MRFFPSFLENENVFHVVVRYVGPAENAAKFKYKVEFVNKDDTEGVSFMYLTRSAMKICVTYIDQAAVGSCIMT